MPSYIGFSSSKLYERKARYIDESIVPFDEVMVWVKADGVFYPQLAKLIAANEDEAVVKLKDDSLVSVERIYVHRPIVFTQRECSECRMHYIHTIDCRIGKIDGDNIKCDECHSRITSVHAADCTIGRFGFGNEVPSQPRSARIPRNIKECPECLLQEGSHSRSCPRSSIIVSAHSGACKDCRVVNGHLKSCRSLIKSQERRECFDCRMINGHLDSCRSISKFQEDRAKTLPAKTRNGCPDCGNAFGTGHYSRCRFYTPIQRGWLTRFLG